MITLANARLHFDTLRYLRPVQLYGRIWFRARRPRPDTRTAPPLRPPVHPWIPGPARGRITTDFQHFRFLNAEGELHGQESWNDPRQDKLWLYNLHYFDYLQSGEGDAGASSGARAGIIKRWIEDNPPVGGNGWEPYPFSLRIVNWIKWHLLGNHLFANAKALVFVGLFFEGGEADAWLGKGLRILGEQAPEQVLEDGGHFELSPMYHGIILEDLLDLVNLAGVYGVDGGRGESRLSDWIPAFAGMTHRGTAGMTHRGGAGTTHKGGAGTTHSGTAGMTHKGGAGTTHSGTAGMTHKGGVGTTHRGAAGMMHKALDCARGLTPGFRCASSRLRFSGASQANLFTGGKGVFENREGLGPAVSAWIDAARAMHGWLGVMCHPDGEIAFFNDAAFGIAPAPGALDDYARRLGVKMPPCSAAVPRALDDCARRLGLGEVSERRGSVVALRDSGYVRLARGPVAALLDVGRIGPDYLPGHAHADSLAFELSFGRQRVIVNGGTSCYGLSEERRRQRATAAHNTVVIDGENSSEVWGGFRVARRAKPHGLEIDDDDDRIRVSCAHDGYRRLPGRPVHRRTWTLGDREFRVRDVIDGGFEGAAGSLHFHPDVEVTITDHGKAGEIRLPDGTVLTFRLAGATGRIVPSTWHPEFGKSVRNDCLEYGFEGNEAEFVMRWN